MDDAPAPDQTSDPLLNEARKTIADLIEVMARLRDPNDGCPWDIEQDFKSIAPYTIEEAYEVADAIAREDMASLKDGWAICCCRRSITRMAEEAGLFDFADVADAISAKMIRRHPHVFGDAVAEDAEAQTASWEAIKAAERAESQNSEEIPSVLDNVPVALPALKRAEKLQNRAARVGFDWPDAAPVIDKIHEEIGELEAEMENGAEKGRLEDELGDILFAVVNLARKLRVEPGSALRHSNLKFEERFRFIERMLAAEGRAPQDVSLDELEALWQRAKIETAK